MDSGIKEYRIFRDSGEIGFATAPRFTDTEVNEGEVHSYTVIAVNRAWLKSAPAPQVWARIPIESLPPHVISVQAQGGPYRVEVHFDTAVNRKQATDADNYTLNRGITVNRAILLPDEKTVRLDTAALTPRTEYILSVSRISDRAASSNKMGTEIRTKFTYDPCLAGHWRFDEGQGTNSVDATGNGNDTSGNAVALQSVEWAPGKWGKALSFDGIWNHVAWSRLSQSLDLTDGLTVSLWAKKGGGQYSHQILIAKSNYYDHRIQFMIDFDESQQVRATVGTLDRGEVSVRGKRIDARGWHNITLSYGSNTLKLYIDGVSQGKATGGDKLMSVSEPITFGGGHQGRDPFKGCLDEIRIYNRALPADEVNALATAVDE